jgi:hypothetical protein
MRIENNCRKSPWFLGTCFESYVGFVHELGPLEGRHAKKLYADSKLPSHQ